MGRALTGLSQLPRLPSTMLSIRLSRTGRRKQPSYRLIVVEKARDPWGKYLELLGHYNPRSKELVCQAERVKHWLSHGAQASATAHNLLLRHGVVVGKTERKVRLSGKRRSKLAEKAKAAAASQA